MHARTTEHGPHATVFASPRRPRRRAVRCAARARAPAPAVVRCEPRESARESPGERSRSAARCSASIRDRRQALRDGGVEDARDVGLVRAAARSRAASTAPIGRRPRRAVRRADAPRDRRRARRLLGRRPAAPPRSLAALAAAVVGRRPVTARVAIATVASRAMARSADPKLVHIASDARNGQTKWKTSVMTTLPSRMPTRRSRIVSKCQRRLEALDHADVERERDLHAGIGDARAPDDDPRRDRRAGGDEQGQRGDRLHARDQEHDRAKPMAAPTSAPEIRSAALLDRRSLAAESDDQTGDDAGADAGPVDGALQDVTDHDRERALQRVVDIARDS